MLIIKWLFWLYLLIAPVIVAISQASILTFPTANFFTGATYNPFPQIFQVPVIIGVFILTIGALATYTLNTLRRKNLPRKLEILIWVSLSLVFIIIFWFGLNFSQRAVIVDYLFAINANGLHFLRISFLPIAPEVFPKNGFLPYYTVIAFGITGVIGIIILLLYSFQQEASIK